MPLGEGYWLNLATGKAVAISEHFTYVRAHPDLFGLAAHDLVGDRTTVLKRVLLNGWCRVRSHAGGTIFEFDSPDWDGSLLAIIGFMHDQGISGKNWVQVADIHRRRMLEDFAENWADRVFFAEPAMDVDTVRTRMFGPGHYEHLDVVSTLEEKVMQKDKAYFINIRTGRSIEVPGCLNYVKTFPARFGISEQDIMESERYPLMRKVLRKSGCVKVYHTDDYTLFEFDNPNMDEATRVIADFMQRKEIRGKHRVQIVNVRARQMADCPAEEWIERVLGPYPSIDMDVVRARLFGSEGHVRQIEVNPLLESGFARVLQHTQLDKGYAVLSAAKHTLSTAENNERMAKLMKDVRGLGFGYIPCTGFFKETSDKKEEQEPSLFIPEMGQKQAQVIAARWNQESFIVGKNNDWNEIEVATEEPIRNGHGFAYVELATLKGPATMVKGKLFQLKNLTEPEPAVAQESNDWEKACPGDIVCAVDKRTHETIFFQVASYVNEGKNGFHGLRATETRVCHAFGVGGGGFALESDQFSGSWYHLEIGRPSKLDEAMAKNLSK